MKKNIDLIKEHRGPMSREVLREKLAEMRSRREGIRLEERRLCAAKAREQYRDMDMDQIRDKWDGSNRAERERMTEFIPDFDEEVRANRIDHGHPDDRNVFEQYWDEIDIVNMSRIFGQYAGIWEPEQIDTTEAVV